MGSYRIIGGDRQEYGPVSGEEVRQWILEGRANGETLGQAEGGMWKKLSLFPEFADLLGQAPVPPATGAAVPPTLPAGVGSRGGDSTDLRKVVQGPAWALMVVGLLDLSMTLLSLVAGTVGWVAPGPGTFPGGAPPELEEFLQYFAGPVGVLMTLVGVVISLFIAWAGWRMLALRSYGACIVASVLAVVPCTAPCCCLGIAAGIWALVVLSRPEVKQAFS